MRKVLFLTAVICLTVTSASAYVCGDANGDQGISVADAVYLVSHIFRGGPAPDPVEAGDADNSGSLDLSDVVYIISHVFRGGPAPCAGPTVEVVQTGECKSMELGTGEKDALNLDCVEYVYDGAATLSLTHINAGFNCCPTRITAEVSLADNVITITEGETFEEGGPCLCLCLFDVEMVVSNLSPGQYTIYVAELYLQNGDTPLEFGVDLSGATSGSYCVERAYYPWEE